MFFMEIAELHESHSKIGVVRYSCAVYINREYFLRITGSGDVFGSDPSDHTIPISFADMAFVISVFFAVEVC